MGLLGKINKAIEGVQNGVEHAVNEAVGEIAGKTEHVAYDIGVTFDRLNEAQKKIIRDGQEQATKLINDAKAAADKIIADAIDAAKRETNNVVAEIVDLTIEKLLKSGKWYFRAAGMIMEKFRDEIKAEVSIK